MRRAQEVIEQHSIPQALPPAVVWQREREVDAVFDQRVAAVRARLPAYRALLAVCGPRAGGRLQGVVWCELPPKLLPLLNPEARARYRVSYSGRGAGKSWASARALIARALGAPVRILCAREYQTSIAESVHALLATQIEELGLAAWFNVQQMSITAANGSEILFAGLHANVSKLKSLEGISIVWIEEGERVADASWQIVIPTIRKPGSEIWCTFNPDAPTDPTYERFVTNPPPGALVEFVSWRDNPWFPPELDAERQ